MLTPQLILRIAGIAAFVVSALFAALAVHYYLTKDIRGVMDDLSGKARARGVAGVRRGTAASSRGAALKGAGADARAVQPTEPQVRQASVEQADPMPVAPSLFVDDEDDIGTVVVPVSYDIEEPETAAGVPASAEVPPATPPQAPDAGGVAFHVTRRIVLIHSQEVIAAG